MEVNRDFRGQSDTRRGPFHIEDTKEGGKLERGLQTCLDEVFPGSTFVSPAVIEGGKTRELTDVLGFDSGFVCLVEAKALAVLTVIAPDLREESGKRAEGYQKGARSA